MRQNGEAPRLLAYKTTYPDVYVLTVGALAKRNFHFHSVVFEFVSEPRDCWHGDACDVASQCDGVALSDDDVGGGVTVENLGGDCNFRLKNMKDVYIWTW